MRPKIVVRRAAVRVRCDSAERKGRQRQAEGECVARVKGRRGEERPECLPGGVALSHGERFSLK